MRKKLYFTGLILIALAVTGAGCVTISSSKSVDGGIFRSDDSGETWMQKVFVRMEKKNAVTLSNVNPLTMIFHPEDKSTVYIGTESNGIWRSKDRAETWTAFGVSSGNYPSLTIDPETPEIVYAATGPSIIKTSDDGQNWETIYLEPRGKSIVSVNIDYYEPSRIIAATQDGLIIESVDYGDTWTTINATDLIKSTIKRLYVNTTDTRVIYAVTLNQGIYKSSDKGLTWALITEEAFKLYPGATTINWFTFTENDPETLYIATNYGIIKSPDSGLTWQPITTLFPFNTVPILTVDVNPNNTDEMYFTIGKVIHKTVDAAATWKTIETFSSGRTITSILVDPSLPETIYAGTYAVKKK